MLFYRGRQNIVDENGDAVSGALATFYLTGTNTLAPVYTTIALDIQHTNPVEASDTGFLPPIYLDPSITYRVVITAADGSSVPDGVVDPIVQTALDQSGFNTLLLTSDPFKRSAAEISAGVTPTNYAIPSHIAAGVFDIQRYGAVNGQDNTVAITRANAVAAQVGYGTIKLTVSGLISTWVIFTAQDVQIDGCGCSQQFATSYAKGSAGPDWAPYNQMFVVNANRVFIHNVRFLGNTVGATTNYFAGSFVWIAQGVLGGGVENCYFQNLRYDNTTNSVAIQVRTTAFDVHIHHNKFVDCTGCVSHQGTHGSVHHNTCQVTDAAAAAAFSVSPGTFDQPIGIDGSVGNKVHDNTCYASSGAPYSPAIIGANTNTTNFQIYANHIYGIHGATALFIRSSNDGMVFGNIIDGLGYTSIGSWCFLRVDVDSNNVDVVDNTLRGPLVAGVGTGLGLDIYTGGNVCRGNKVMFGTNTAAASLLHIGKATTPVISVFEDNFLQGGGIGTRLDLSDNILAATGIEVPIIHRNNTFATPITTPYSCTGASRQVKFYIENDAILSTSYAPAANVLPPRIQQMFRAGLSANFWFKVGVNLEIHSVAVPSGSNYEGGTYETGDIIYHAQTVAGGSEGWKCTTGGTIPFSSAFSQAGTATSGSPTITGLADTSLALVGDYVSPSARWATTGPYKVIAKTASSLTLDTNANSSGAATMTHFAPVFKTLAVVAA
jgi:hypothetical protein